MVFSPPLPCPVVPDAPGAAVLAPARALDRHRVGSWMDQDAWDDEAGNAEGWASVCVSVGLALDGEQRFQLQSEQRLPRNSHPPSLSTSNYKMQIRAGGDFCFGD